jgi:hypothetical protein
LAATSWGPVCRGEERRRERHVADVAARQVVVDLIGATTTRTGLTVHAAADTNTYPRGIKVSDDQMATVAAQLAPDKFHGEWNYTMRPAKTTPKPEQT